jgi:hypothetical protein
MRKGFDGLALLVQERSSVTRTMGIYSYSMGAAAC